MDYEFFENLSPREAKDYLERYLELESCEAGPWFDQAQSVGVRADFTVESIADVFEWIASQIRLREVEPPRETPAWLSESMEEHGGFVDFDEQSRPPVLRGSYYLGQAFVSSHPQLRWALGRSQRAEFQQPVVTGFRTDADLPSLVVAENLLLGVNQPDFGDRIRTAIASWSSAL